VRIVVQYALRCAINLSKVILRYKIKKIKEEEEEEKKKKDKKKGMLVT
jgi:hypothetical protein